MKFKEIVDIRTGKLNANASDENGKYPFYTCADVPLKINTIIGDYECLLLVGNGANTGKVFYNIGPFNAYQRTYILKPYKNNDAKFIYWFLNSKKDYLLSRSIGSATNYIKLGDIENLDYPDTSKIDTVKAALLFDKIQSIIYNCNKQLEKLDLLIKARFVEMFGDFKINSKGWKIARFTDIAIIDGNMTTDFETYADYPHIGIDSIEKETGALKGYRTVAEDNVVSGKYLFTPQHIIYSKIRPNLNKVALPDFNGVCSADAYPILPKSEKCNRLFLAYVMRSSYFLDYILQFCNRTNLPKVNRKEVSGFSTPLPPLALQEQFAAFVEQTDKSKLAVKQVLEKAETLKKALMQEYFG